MPFSEQLEKDLKKEVKTRARLKAKADLQIDKSCERYHSWYQSCATANYKPISIIAEGDSWFLYVIGRAVIYQLEKKLDIEILNLAFPGDEVAGMLGEKQRKRLIRELKVGPAQGEKYDFFLFSGGGNDLVGKDVFFKWLNPWKPGTTDLNKVINENALAAAFEILKIGYRDVIEIRDNYSPNTHLFFHGYDYAQPSGKGVCGIGPWLEPGLVHRKIPKTKRAAVVKLFLQRFNDVLLELAAENEKVIVVPTQDTLNKNEWHNELHPTNSGFKKIAARFVESMLGEGSPGEGRDELTSTGRARRRRRRPSDSIV